MSEFVKTLRDLSNQNVAIIRDIEENDGELTEELEDIFTVNSLELADKVDRYSFLMRDLESSIEGDKNLIKELQAQVKRKQSKLDWLDVSVRTAMLNMNVETLEGNISSFKLGTAGGVAKLNIDDPQAAIKWGEDLGMQIFVEEPVLDNKAVRHFVELGHKIPGVSLTRSYTLKRKILNKLGDKK